MENMEYKFLKQIKEIIEKTEKGISVDDVLGLINHRITLCEKGLPKNKYRVEVIKSMSIGLEVIATSAEEASIRAIESAKLGEGMRSDDRYKIAQASRK